MPHYFFNTRIHDDVVRDDIGVTLSDPDQAWEKAREMVLHLLKMEAEKKPGRSYLIAAIVEVTDRDGDIVLEFPFSEALIDPGGFATKH